MFNFKKFKIGWLLLFIFLVGWSISLNLIEDKKIYYTLLTIISFFSFYIAINKLNRPMKQEVYLWAILIIFFVGYYLKFYILCYLKVDLYSDYINLYQNEANFLGNSAQIIRYFETITTVSFIFSILIYILVKKSKLVLKKHYLDKLNITPIYMDEDKVKLLIIGFTFLFIIIAYLNFTLGIGLVSSADRQVIELPYRLSGIISALFLNITPLLLLIAVWLADLTSSKSNFKIAVFIYLIYGVVAGLMSTSKAPMINVFISITILWFVTSKLTKGRLFFLILLIIFIGFFNGILSINRIMRVTNPELGLFEILLIVFHFIFAGDEYLFGYEGSINFGNYYLGLLMRINGADSLMNIIAYSPIFSFSRVWNIFESSDTIAKLYALDVLGRDVEYGVAFSPSLLGYFYFLYGNITLVSISFAGYIIFWNFLFNALFRSKLVIEPIIFSILIGLLVHYTSEGSLEALPQSLFLLIVLACIVEYATRSLIAKRPEQKNSRLRAE